MGFFPNRSISGAIQPWLGLNSASYTPRGRFCTRWSEVGCPLLKHPVLTQGKEISLTLPTAHEWALVSAHFAEKETEPRDDTSLAEAHTGCSAMELSLRLSSGCFWNLCSLQPLPSSKSPSFPCLLPLPFARYF